MIKKTRFRNSNLDDAMVIRIVQLLDGWPNERLSWKAFIEKIELATRKRYTRQALHNHARIRDAFALKKTVLRSCIKPQIPSPTPDQERILRLEAEVNRLKMENNNLLEQFHRWVYNGHLYSLGENMRSIMNSPLPSNFRDPSRID
ncbi:hypothetical protein GCM10017655_48410 [Pseudomonas turukhanskensis]|uniref:Uncharacterized protein n=1 Tax=Pseudomonas turukhanskensis TaxID=1806536 RepID=A0A9W6KA57_9PSED|nr:hypothetical protein GCM10017655_48410 [Pseudomonas turukhanskensis]